MTDDEKALRRSRKLQFKGKCPYTEKKCTHFKCEHCAVEEYERKWMNEVTYEDIEQ